MKITVPQHFDVKVNLKKALCNGAGVVLFISLITQEPLILGAAFIFGLLGGSVNDLYAFLKNKEAIISYNSKKEEDGE